MSTLNVSNITDGTTTLATEYVVNGSAKAWVHFQGTGTVAVRDSLNITSITDNGSGLYAPNFTASLSGLYSVVGHAIADANFPSVVGSYSYGRTSSDCDTNTTSAGGVSGWSDISTVDVSIHGDLA